MSSVDRDERVERLADEVVQMIADLPRFSPEDQPDMMLVTADELRDFIREAWARSQGAVPSPDGPTRVEVTLPVWWPSGERERRVSELLARIEGVSPPGTDVRARLAPPEPGPAAAELARAVVLWDGANEDGCAFCGVEWPENGDSYLPHEKTCAVVVHRLELIAALVAEDPAPGSPKGERLKALATTQERYERATIRLA